MVRCWSLCKAFVVLAAVALGIAIRFCVTDPPDVEPSHSPFMRLSDGRILEYAEAGDRSGAPVLVVHGSLQDGSAMCGLVHLLFEEHRLRALCPTLPGYGHSSWTDAPTEDWYKDVAQLMLHLKVERFVATAGWSAGGLMAAVAASGLGDLAGDRLLLAVPMPPDVSWMGDYGPWGLRVFDVLRESRLPNLFYHYFVVPMLRHNCTQFVQMSLGSDEAGTVDSLNVEDMCTGMLRSVSHSDRGITALWQRWIRYTPISWESVSSPGRTTLVVYAENDTLVPPKSAIMYHKHIAGSRLFYKPGAGHSLTAFSAKEYIGFLWGEEPSAELKEVIAL